MKTTVVTDTATIVAFGRKARVHFVTISNTGTAGTEGELELREAQNPAGDTGTLRWVARFLGTDSLVAHYEFGGDSGAAEGIEFDDGIRVVFDAMTNAQVTVGWS